MKIKIELFGVPRRRVGLALATVELAESPCRLGDVIDALVEQYPTLSTEVTVTENRYRNVIVCADNERFLRSPSDVVRQDERIFLLSADVGG